MERMREVRALTPETLTVLVQYRPDAHGNKASVVGLPEEITLTEKREVLELALTIVNQAIADEMIAVIPDDPEHDDQNNLDALYEISADDAAPNDATSSDITNTLPELQYEPLDDASAILARDKGIVNGDDSSQVQQRKARANTVIRPAKGRAKK